MIDLPVIMDVILSMMGSIENLLVSGKLDLQDDVKDVIEMVCQSVFLRYEIDDKNNILILK